MIVYGLCRAHTTATANTCRQVEYYGRRYLTTISPQVSRTRTTVSARPTVATTRTIATPPTTKPQSDPLRILFCGSDAFSCASLRALHAEQQRNRALVERLEVMVVPSKRAGRGLKLREVPCKALAEELGLPMHQRETFREWPLPDGINLIVAVSFRLFVPERILKSAKYGGLNVHPSLLPHLRGPAPIHHAILRGDAYTGVSLQTLDAQAFDQGAVLAQTARPGIPISAEDTLASLTERLAQRGAEMLVQGLRDGLHVLLPAVVSERADEDKTGEQEKEEKEMKKKKKMLALVHAPKPKKADLQMDWAAWRAVDVARRSRAFGGALWTYAVVVAAARARTRRSGSGGSGSRMRVLLTRLRVLTSEEACSVAVEETAAASYVVKFVVMGRQDDGGEKTGGDGDGDGDGGGGGGCDGGAEHVVGVRVDEGSGVCFVKDAGGTWMALERAKVEGGVERDAAGALRMFLERREED